MVGCGERILGVQIRRMDGLKGGGSRHFAYIIIVVFFSSAFSSKSFKDSFSHSRESHDSLKAFEASASWKQDLPFCSNIGPEGPGLSLVRASSTTL